jgi:hypothetical protein
LEAVRFMSKRIVLFAFLVIFMSGCFPLPFGQVETIAAYQINATVFAVEMEATTTSFASTADSMQSTITEMYRATDTPSKTPTPSITPTPSETPTPEFTATSTPVPLPPHKTVLVTAEKTPLRYAKKDNKQGIPVMVIYESNGKRYVFAAGQEVMVYPGKVVGDGGSYYWQVLPGQSDMYGRWVPSSPALYLLASHVKLIG